MESNIKKGIVKWSIITIVLLKEISTQHLVGGNSCWRNRLAISKIKYLNVHLWYSFEVFSINFFFFPVCVIMLEMNISISPIQKGCWYLEPKLLGMIATIQEGQFEGSYEFQFLVALPLNDCCKQKNTYAALLSVEWLYCYIFIFKKNLINFKCQIMYINKTTLLILFI